jgi:adenylate cyclase
MMGKGVLRNLFFGRYHTPREQKRIIGFVDLTSSTSIAEKLSPQEYSSFIRDFFYDLDEAFEETKGAVFQFVGDEVVVIWNHQDGIINNNCVRFFFLAEDLIKEKEEYYISRYGLSPKFKAGVHSGNVVVAEVGGSKTDIAYHGDTINTAARIRSECGKLDRTLLISAELLSLLKDIDNDYEIESMGVTTLKGKENVIALISVARK